MRITSIALVLFAALLEFLPSQIPGTQNILIVVADDLGVDQVGCYQEGANPPPTPTIDSLASSGVLFRNAWSCPTCSPTRTCIQTGRFSMRTSVGHWIVYENNGTRTGTLQPGEWTIPKVLDRGASGYAHAAIGKWHMNRIEEGPFVPNSIAGYDTFMGHLPGSPSPSYFNYQYTVNGTQTTSTTYATTKQVDDALAWIQSQTSPWLCYLAFSAPHTPLHAPPANLHSRNLTGLNPAGSNAHKREFYKAMIEALDTELGRLLTTLGPAVMANTNVIFLGDNGDPIGMAEPPFNSARGKTTPYEAGINVPMIISGPHVVGAAREDARLVHVVDVFATALDMAGVLAAVPPCVQIDGVSLIPYLESDTGPALRTTAYVDQYQGDYWPDPVADLSGFGIAMLRNDRFKLIARNTGVVELYDLQLDPFEAVNLLSGVLNAQQQQNYNTLTATMNTIRVAPQLVFSFGSNACVGSAGLPSAQVLGEPAIGFSYTVSLSSAAPLQLGFLAIGFSELQHQSLDLPFDLTSIGAGSGCLLEHSLDLLSLVAISANGSASRAISLPNNPMFVGVPLFHSYVVMDLTAPGNVLGLVNSNAMAVCIGR